MSAPEFFHGLELCLPHTLTVLCTYQCTAACKQCCFESSPRVKGRLSIDAIISRISEAKESFPGLRLVVFSGGEAFLLKEDLFTAVAHASSLGMMTRIVTNGSWGKSEKSASLAAERLLQSGISEINISTGLDHQEWVPLESVANAASALCERGIRTLITVESDTPSSNCLDAARRHPSIVNAFKSGYLSLQCNSWMAFSTGSDGRVKNFDPSGLEKGCTQIFGNIVVTPHDNLSACCGLTLEHIPEMRLGKNTGSNMRELFQSQYDDFLKFWIHVDGPYKIVKRVLGEEQSKDLLSGVSHICEACAILHKTPEIKKRLAETYSEFTSEVMTRFALAIRDYQEAMPAEG